jgi:hypothetical protein
MLNLMVSAVTGFKMLITPLNGPFKFKGSFILQAEPSRAEPNRTEPTRLGKETFVMKWKHSHCTPNRAELNRTEPDRACSLADVCFYSPADDRFCFAVGLTSWG